jgi:hypothetical protein
MAAHGLQYLRNIFGHLTFGKTCSNHYTRKLQMSQAAPSSENMVNDIPAELLDLQKVIDTLPPAQRVTVLPAFQRVVESTNRRRKILQLVQESIGQLRLDMKYLVFDLEATRRERDLYQKQLEEMNGDSFNGGDESNPEGNDE